MAQIIELSTTTIDLLKDNIDKPWWATLVSAFAGAAFAFLFVILGEALKKVYEKQKNNYISIVKIDYICNQNFVIADEIILQSKNLIKAIELYLNNGIIEFNFVNFDKLLDYGDLVGSLENIEFLDLVFVLNVDTRRINTDTNSLFDLYHRLNNDFRQKIIFKESYLLSLDRLKKSLKEHIAVINDFIEKNKNVMASGRFLIDSEKSFFYKFIKKYQNNNLIGKNKELIYLIREQISIGLSKSKDDCDKKLKKIFDNIDK